MVLITAEPADEPPAGAIVIAAGPGSKFTPAEIQTAATGPTLFFVIKIAAADDYYYHIINGGDLPPPARGLANTTATPGASPWGLRPRAGLGAVPDQVWGSLSKQIKEGTHN